MIQLEFLFFRPGDKVRCVDHIYEEADDHSPAGYLARKGDLLVVRIAIEFTHAKKWPYSVSHESRTDGNTFSCAATEIEPM